MLPSVRAGEAVDAAGAVGAAGAASAVASASVAPGPVASAAGVVPAATGAGVTSAVAPVLHRPPSRHANNRQRMLAGLVLALVFLVGIALAGQLLAPAASATDFSAKNLAPSAAHPFGTDWMGRDMLARTLAGLSTSVFVGLLSSACSAALALVLALVAGLGGRGADAAVCFLIDLVTGIPHIVLLVLVSYALGKGALGVTVAVAVTHWPSLTRVLRAETIQLRDAPYLQISRALGTDPAHIAAHHLLPALLPQLIVGVVVAFPHAILHEASITFLGFGLSAEQPAIGVILSEAMGYLSTGSWWLALLPGAALLAVVLAFSRIGALASSLVGARMVQG